jgi:hypothetical protein
MLIRLRTQAARGSELGNPRFRAERIARNLPREGSSCMKGIVRGRIGCRPPSAREGPGAPFLTPPQRGPPLQGTATGTSRLATSCRLVSRSEASCEQLWLNRGRKRSSQLRVHFVSGVRIRGLSRAASSPCRGWRRERSDPRHGAGKAAGARTRLRAARRVSCSTARVDRRHVAFAVALAEGVRPRGPPYQESRLLFSFSSATLSLEAARGPERNVCMGRSRPCFW